MLRRVQHGKFIDLGQNIKIMIFLQSKVSHAEFPYCRDAEDTCAAKHKNYKSIKLEPQTENISSAQSLLL